MRFLCSTVLLFVLSSLCDAQFQQANVQVDGFSCQPSSLFRFQCNLCRCNLFGSSAQCVLVECQVERPEPEEKPKKKSEKLCTPGQKKLEGCVECVCTASLLWACSDSDCKRPGNAIGSPKKIKKRFSYECYKIIEQAFWVCESKTTVCGKYLLNINRISFFPPRYIEIDSFCMRPSCALIEVKKAVKSVCPEGEDTLDLDDTEAEQIPVTTTMLSEPDNPTTVKNLEATSPDAKNATTVENVETTVKQTGTSPRDDPTTLRDDATSPQNTESPTTSSTTTKNPEGIDTSVEMVSTTDAASEDTTIDDINDSGEVPRDVIEESGDSFTQEEMDSEDFECKPNKSFKLECNFCWCKADGKGPRYCTRIECMAKIKIPLAIK